MIVQPAAWRSELVQSVARVTRVSLVELLNSASGNAQDRQSLLNALRGNGTVAARVLETRADGVSVVELASARVALRLNTTPAPGEHILISLEDATGPATQVPEGIPGGTAPAPGRTKEIVLNQSIRELSSVVPATAGESAPKALARAAEVTLSRTALLVNDIQKSSSNQVVTETSSTAPLAPHAASPKSLAHALQQTVRSSGLFYESHLRDWVDGRIALADLSAEPQARITPAAAQDAGAGHAATDARPVVHPQLEPLVRQQLDTFEQQRIAWHGPLWPGQQADIVISGEPPPADSQVPRTWRVQLALDTPTLGLVKADVALTGRTLSVRLNGAGAGVHALRDGRAALASALGAHDLEVNPIHIAGDAP